MNIQVNNENKTVYTSTISYDEILNLAGANPTKDSLRITAAYQDGVTVLTVSEDDVVLVKSGMQINVEKLN